MSDYTIEDLKDKYVKTGTPEAEVFFAACENVGIKSNSKGIFGYPLVEAVDVGSGVLLYGCLGEERLETNSKRFTTWTPQNNTLPLRDLSDEQAAQLFNAWRGGARIESPGEMILSNMPSWDPDFVYRVMKKSPKQEFFDSIIEHYKGSTFLDNYVIDMLESAYDAGLFTQTEELKK